MRQFSDVAVFSYWVFTSTFLYEIQTMYLKPRRNQGFGTKTYINLHKKLSKSKTNL